ncbi:hypothetical protein [Bradyrhizobium sp. Tv2a-2]|uniref:hypothetical protein n=1 Tax=Bradyrhizobium sp. Tv2a-2 TaxID=113395 RepID=UPI0018DBCEAE|nr:hypothetical protein [Bradyrhizobium sp. Tv2a-2]
MAMACCGDRAPCSPWRILSISSRTNSPAWVLADFPARLSALAFRIVSFRGIEMFPQFQHLTRQQGRDGDCSFGRAKFQRRRGHLAAQKNSSDANDVELFSGKLMQSDVSMRRESC